MRVPKGLVQYFNILILLTVGLLADSAARAFEFTITSNNPLYRHAYDANGTLIEKFNVDFKTLADYYSFASNGLIKPNPDRFFESTNHTSLNISLDSLTFQVNTTKMSITPNLPISPESAQSLFIQDDTEFTRRNGGLDFVESKVNSFKQLTFNEETQRYERTMFLLSDWKSLIHPPVRNIGTTQEQQDSYFRTSHEIRADSNILKADWNRKIDTLSESELTRGNQLKILVNGDSFKEKMAQVKAAKKSIYVMVMSFASDPSSFELIDALVEKSKQGVEVQVILEKLWTVTVFRKTMERFTQGGVKLLLANDMFSLSKKKRTLFHNKVWIFDDETAIIGGQNIVNSSNNSTGFNHWNKDTDVLIHGPMVTDILDEFTTIKDRYDVPRSERKTARFNLDQGRTVEQLNALISQRKEQEKLAGTRGTDRYENWFSSVETGTEGVCRYVIQGPQKSNTILSKTYSEYFRAAKRELFLTSQHIEYDQDEVEDGFQEEDEETTRMFSALFDSADNGVEVNLVANGIDGGFAEIGQNIAMGNKNPRRERRRQRRYARQIARGEEPSSFLSRMSVWLGLRGARKYKRYLDDSITHANFNAWMHFQYVHSKTVLIDNTMASIGSFNFEPYSAEHSHESAIFCNDRQLVRDLKSDYIRDIVNSTPVLVDSSDDSTEQN
jgi:phosphatidylserine/phosphatidylglycerophosphate/cardiolipin synthase-like enzyme